MLDDGSILIVSIMSLLKKYTFYLFISFMINIKSYILTTFLLFYVIFFLLFDSTQYIIYTDKIIQ